jgi:hypothetical protein
MAAGMDGFAVISNPGTVEVEGPASQVSKVDAVATEEIDAGRLAKGKEYQKNLLLPTKKVVVLHEEPVIIKVVPLRKKR